MCGSCGKGRTCVVLWLYLCADCLSARGFLLAADDNVVRYDPPCSMRKETRMPRLFRGTTHSSAATYPSFVAFRVGYAEVHFGPQSIGFLGGNSDSRMPSSRENTSRRQRSRRPRPPACTPVSSSCRALFTQVHPEVMLTDTVGFIQKLPTNLVAAFRATLEEVYTPQRRDSI